MATASIVVSGPDVESSAHELQATMAAAAAPEETVSPAEVERSPELVIAVIGLVFSGVSTAKAVWDWFRAKPPGEVSVKVLLADGTELDMSKVDEQQLVLEFEQRAQSDR